MKTSDNKYYDFYLTNDYGIAYNYFTGEELNKKSTLIKTGILDFSVAIDKYDRIHLICLTKEGNLLYYIYSKNEWQKYELTKFNLTSSKVKYLTLHIIGDNIHIFYIYNSIINKNIWTINHLSVSKNKWRKQNIISYNGSKFVSPFYIDFDYHNNIHLVYKSNYEDSQHIYYTSYSSFLKKWNHSPQILSKRNTDNSYPYLFVDDKNTVHVIWCSLINGSFKLIYKQLPYLQNNTYRWKQFEIPNIQGNIMQPIMYQENNVLKGLVKYNGTLKGLYSSDYGYSWLVDDSIGNLDADKAIFIRYCSNSKKAKYKTKINHAYGHIDKKIMLYYCNEFPYTFVKSPNSNKNDNNLNNQIKSEINKEEKSSNQKSMITVEDLHTENKDSLIEKPQLLKKLDTFDNEYVKQFVSNTKSKLDTILLKTNEIKSIKEEIENILLKNSQELDKKITSREDIINDIINTLNALQNIINNYNLENEAFLELLNSIKNQYEKNSLEIEKFESQINEIKKIAESYNKSNFIQKFLDYFK